MKQTFFTEDLLIGVSDNAKMISDFSGEVVAIAVGYSIDGEVIYRYPDGGRSTRRPENSHPGNMEVKRLPDGRHYYANKRGL